MLFFHPPPQRSGAQTRAGRGAKPSKERERERERERDKLCCLAWRTLSRSSLLKAWCSRLIKVKSVTVVVVALVAVVVVVLLLLFLLQLLLQLSKDYASVTVRNHGSCSSRERE